MFDDDVDECCGGGGGDVGWGVGFVVVREASEVGADAVEEAWGEVVCCVGGTVVGIWDWQRVVVAAEEGGERCRCGRGATA